MPLFIQRKNEGLHGTFLNTNCCCFVKKKSLHWKLEGEHITICFKFNAFEALK